MSELGGSLSWSKEASSDSVCDAGGARHLVVVNLLSIVKMDHGDW